MSPRCCSVNLGIGCHSSGVTGRDIAAKLMIVWKSIYVRFFVSIKALKAILFFTIHRRILLMPEGDALRRNTIPIGLDAVCACWP